MFFVSCSTLHRHVISMQISMFLCMLPSIFLFSSTLHRQIRANSNVLFPYVAVFCPLASLLYPLSPLPLILQTFKLCMCACACALKKSNIISSIDEVYISRNKAHSHSVNAFPKEELSHSRFTDFLLRKVCLKQSRERADTLLVLLTCLEQLMFHYDKCATSDFIAY